MRQGFVITVLASQEKHQQDLRIHAGFAVSLGALLQILESLILVSAQPDHRGRRLHSPGQASDHVVVRTHDQLGFDRGRRKLQHAFVVVTRAHGIAQRRKPGPLDHRCVGGKLGAGYASGIQSFDVIRVGAQPLLLELLGARDQVLNLLLDFGVRGTVRRGDETVVGVLSGVQHSHAIKFAEKNHGQEMVDGEGIVRMARQNLLKLLNRAVVVEIVEVTKRGQVERIVRTVGERFRRRGSLQRFGKCDGLSRNQEGYQKQSGALETGRRQSVFSQRGRCTLV